MAALQSSSALRVLSAERPGIPLSTYALDHAEQLSQSVSDNGAVLLRGFDVTSSADFQAFVEALKARTMQYTYRSTPRSKVERDVFTATEYPPALEIPLHSENSYQRSWPMWLVLCCITPAASGGQTPIADLTSVTQAIGSEIVDRFETLGVKYIRHYRPYVDLRWQDVFQTEDRQELGQICAERGIDFRWLDEETLRTEQVCQGVARHPVTSARVFFNQAHLFHPSALGAAVAADLTEYYGRDRLPRMSTFGDGSEFDEETLNRVRSAFSASAVDVEWRQGDVVILDNMQFAHGRRPYQGERRVLASLLNEHFPAQTGAPAVETVR